MNCPFTLRCILTQEAIMIIHQPGCKQATLRLMVSGNLENDDKGQEMMQSSLLKM